MCLKNLCNLWMLLLLARRALVDRVEVDVDDLARQVERPILPRPGADVEPRRAAAKAEARVRQPADAQRQAVDPELQIPLVRVAPCAQIAVLVGANGVQRAAVGQTEGCLLYTSRCV